MKHLLVGRFGSKRAHAVLDAATRLARSVGGRLTLIRSVGRPPDVPQDFFKTTDQALLDSLCRGARLYLEGCAAQRVRRRYRAGRARHRVDPACEREPRSRFGRSRRPAGILIVRRHGRAEPFRNDDEAPIAPTLRGATEWYPIWRAIRPGRSPLAPCGPRNVPELDALCPCSRAVR
jgi:hypothetical protein